jgi:hypothetical protein
MSTIVSFPVDLITLFWWWGDMEIPHTRQLVTSSTPVRDGFLNTGRTAPRHRVSEVVLGHSGCVCKAWVIKIGICEISLGLHEHSGLAMLLPASPPPLLCLTSFWVSLSSSFLSPSPLSSPLTQSKTTTAGQTISKTPLLIIPAAD